VENHLHAAAAEDPAQLQQAAVQLVAVEGLAVPLAVAGDVTVTRCGCCSTWLASLSRVLTCRAAQRGRGAADACLLR